MSKTTKNDWQAKKKNAKSILRKQDLGFFEELINTPSPTGFEWTGQQVWIDYMRDYSDDITIDTYGTAVATINPWCDYSVVLEAHCDEISWFVNYITDEGMLHVIRNGWSDHQIAPSKRVLVHGKKWDVEGLFGRPAIHTRGPLSASKDVKLEVENLTVDVGASDKDEIEKLWIVVWSVITYPDTFHTLNNRYYVWRAMDNRAGGFMISQVARLLQESKTQLPFTLHIVNAVQEEIGLKGAEMIAHTLNPNVALVVDMCHDTSTPMINKKKEWDTQCGKWPVLSVWPSVHNGLRDLIEATAKKKKIEFQRLASSRWTGTDTDAFAYSRGGIASALFLLPIRYMHTTVEMAHYDDVENTIQLMLESVKAIKWTEDWKYLRV